MALVHRMSTIEVYSASKYIMNIRKIWKKIYACTCRLTQNAKSYLMNATRTGKKNFIDSLVLLRFPYEFNWNSTYTGGRVIYQSFYDSTRNAISTAMHV